MLFILVLLLLPASLAQRPQGASICDYYANHTYGSSTSTTQFQLVQNIVALAFAGSSNISSPVTGILNPGKFNSAVIDLGSWFNGSKDVTNSEGEPYYTNWLDGGGTTPFTDFLAGKTKDIAIKNTTLQYALVNHQLLYFSRYIQCSLAEQKVPATKLTPNLAYVHKFMELDFNETGHYINQFSLATSQFGFSQQDSQGLYAQWTELFNYACLPAVNGTLNSICSDETCPYANFGDKYPDCGLYQTLQASGIVTAANTARPSDYVPTVSSAATAPPNSGRASTTASTPTPSQLQSTTSTPAAAASSSLGAGEIAGIVIGGGALTFAFILALVFMIKRMNNKSSNSMYNPSLSTTARGTEPPRSYLGHQAVNSWNGPIAEMESKPGSPPPESGHFTIDSGMTERRDARLPGAGG